MLNELKVMLIVKLIRMITQCLVWQCSMLLNICCFIMSSVSYTLKKTGSTQCIRKCSKCNVSLCVIGLVQEGCEFPQSHWLRLDQYWWRDGDAQCGAK